MSTVNRSSIHNHQDQFPENSYSAHELHLFDKKHHALNSQIFFFPPAALNTRIHHVNMISTRKFFIIEMKVMKEKKDDVSQIIKAKCMFKYWKMKFHRKYWSKPNWPKQSLNKNIPFSNKKNMLQLVLLDLKSYFMCFSISISSLK